MSGYEPPARVGFETWDVPAQAGATHPSNLALWLDQRRPWFKIEAAVRRARSLYWRRRNRRKVAPR